MTSYGMIYMQMMFIFIINSWEFHIHIMYMKFPTIYSPKNPKITLGGRI